MAYRAWPTDRKNFGCEAKQLAAVWLMIAVFVISVVCFVIFIAISTSPLVRDDANVNEVAASRNEAVTSSFEEVE